jgi:hypothetical protein
MRLFARSPGVLGQSASPTERVLELDTIHWLPSLKKESHELILCEKTARLLDIRRSERVTSSAEGGDMPARSRHIRSHIREKRSIPTWNGRPGFPLLKRLWQKRSLRSSFHAKTKPSWLLKRSAPQRNRIPTPDHLECG